MIRDDELLIQTLMQDAADYLRQGMFEDAAEIMAVAESLECGKNPFADELTEDDFWGDTNKTEH